MSVSTPSQREEAYLARFGTRHPSRAQVMAWARDLFPEMSSLQLKTRGGRTWLINGNTTLGVGSDAVEAVAAADIARKQSSVASQANQNTNTPIRTMPETPNQPATNTTAPGATGSIDNIRAALARVNRATVAVNEILLKAPGMLSHDAEEIKELNLAVIDANLLVGSPIQQRPVADIPEAVNPKPGVATSDPKVIAQALQ